MNGARDFACRNVRAALGPERTGLAVMLARKVDPRGPRASFISTKPLSTDPKPHLRRQLVLLGGAGQRRSEAGYPGGDDVVDPCRACDRRNSGAGPVSGKKISTLSRVRLRQERDPQEKSPARVCGARLRGRLARLGWGRIKRAMILSGRRSGEPQQPSESTHAMAAAGKTPR